MWDWYRDLSVSFGGMGGTDFHSEIVAYSILTGAEPSPWDVAMLRAIFRVHMMSATKKPEPGQGPAVVADVDASDGAAVSGLLRGMGAKKRDR
ncbi:hypothetical protein [Mesorhizobium sp. B2-4-11]|uniref:hypothetical protein n=1 Tax=Mesorhizobium sp. B2-4-11 TaxID=2589938 RepID=UPI001128B442|nr:hypothetical protein [Mesorhizobium sp. B2-4-11]TPL06688.1 hypothetical protein FJ944_22940 [Mesorhizobium sp. B2-4-11]